MHTLTTDLRELAQVTATALLFGAGLPTIFAIAIRLQSTATESGADGRGTANSVRLAAGIGSALCYAVVAAAVLAGVLYVAKGFLASRLDIHLFSL
ncbi:hypothetical protein [Nocardia stercoris]|uniref:Uncharacterized protein n=1 Tax=Nocardia stercoris TaxID=2483361 RepID=A0A3M2L4U0_9NOCA|nr:hypothetical protein [Nocardia stercoris]RMI30895.1 hypothetical protein EBN03_19845 [Nocardia stercoris]